MSFQCWTELLGMIQIRQRPGARRQTVIEKPENGWLSGSAMTRPRYSLRNHEKLTSWTLSVRSAVTAWWLRARLGVVS